MPPRPIMKDAGIQVDQFKETSDLIKKIIGKQLVCERCQCGTVKVPQLGI